MRHKTIRSQMSSKWILIEATAKKGCYANWWRRIIIWRAVRWSFVCNGADTLIHPNEINNPRTCGFAVRRVVFANSAPNTEYCVYNKNGKISLRDCCCCFVLPLSQFRWTFSVRFSWQMHYWLPQCRCRCPIWTFCPTCAVRIWTPSASILAAAAAAGVWLFSFDHRRHCDPFYHSNSTDTDSDWLWCIGALCRSHTADWHNDYTDYGCCDRMVNDSVHLMNWKMETKWKGERAELEKLKIFGEKHQLNETDLRESDSDIESINVKLQSMRYT